VKKYSYIFLFNNEKCQNNEEYLESDVPFIIIQYTIKKMKKHSRNSNFVNILL